jgi:hypothetical protein
MQWSLSTYPTLSDVNFDIKFNDNGPKSTSHQLAKVHLQDETDSIDLTNIDVNFDAEQTNPLGTELP